MKCLWQPESYQFYNTLTNLSNNIYYMWEDKQKWNVLWTRPTWPFPILEFRASDSGSLGWPWPVIIIRPYKPSINHQETSSCIKVRARHFIWYEFFRNKEKKVRRKGSRPFRERPLAELSYSLKGTRGASLTFNRFQSKGKDLGSNACCSFTL